MLYLRLAHGGGIVEVTDAAEIEIEDESLILKSPDGRVVCRLNRMDVLAYSERPELLEDGTSRRENGDGRASPS